MGLIFNVLRSGHALDPADSETIPNALQAQGQTIHRHDEQLSVLRHERREGAEFQGNILSAFG